MSIFWFSTWHERGSGSRANTTGRAHPWSPVPSGSSQEQQHITPCLEGDKNLRPVPPPWWEMLPTGHSRVPGKQIAPPCLALLLRSPQPGIELGGKTALLFLSAAFSHSRSFEPQAPQAVVVRRVGAARRAGTFKPAGASGHFQAAAGAPPPHSWRVPEKQP